MNRVYHEECDQQLMVLIRRYCEVAQALGIENSGFWGDVLGKHEMIVETAEIFRKRAVACARNLDCETSTDPDQVL
jgi:hypothetical protein